MACRCRWPAIHRQCGCTRPAFRGYRALPVEVAAINGDDRLARWLVETVRGNTLLDAHEHGKAPQERSPVHYRVPGGFQRLRPTRAGDANCSVQRGLRQWAILDSNQ